MTRILAISGSYRSDGITDQTVNALTNALKETGAEVEIIHLREYRIEFCLNCRECTQKPGDAPGECIQHDGMMSLIKKIEAADGYILASPTNFGSVTALFKRFMERLIAYAYWPWGQEYPKLRKAKLPQKKAILVSSCAAPGGFGRLFYSTHKQLKTTAETIGAKAVGTLFTGLVSKEPQPRLPENLHPRIEALAKKLV